MLRKSVQIPPCPVCTSPRVAPGKATEGSGNAPVFYLQGLEINFWKFTLSFPALRINQPIWLCVACGHLWSSTDLAEARRQIRDFGSEALKARLLEPGETLPRPAAAPKSDDRALPLPAAQGKDEG